MKLCNDCAYLGRQRPPHIFVCRNGASEHFEDTLIRDETREACQLYQSKGGQLTNLKFIEDYRGRYPDSEFWIIGSDSNLDYYPDDFFNDKLSIVINASTIAFPDSTYILLNDTRVVDAIKYAEPHLLEKCLIILGRTGKGWESYGTDPIYMRIKTRKRVDQYIRDDWQLMVEQIFGNGSCEFLSCGTSASFAIEAAVVMGAKRIILVACSGRILHDRYYAQKRGMWAFAPKHVERPNLSQELPLIKQDLKLLTQLLGKHDINIMRHYFNGNEFVFEKGI